MGPTSCHLLIYGEAEVASARSNCLRFNLRQAVWVGAWNIWSLQQDEGLLLLSRELKWLGVEVAALSEVRRPDGGTVSMGGYTYYWSGQGDAHHL